MKRETKGAWIDEEQKTDHERWREKSTSFHFHGSMDWDGFEATIGKIEETILHCFLCSLVSAICPFKLIFQVLFWHLGTQRTAKETTNTKQRNLPTVIWNPPDLKTCSCRRYQACQSHKGPTPSLSSLPHRSLRCLWELWDLRCLWCLRWFWRLRHFHLQQWRSQRQQESMKRETKGAWIDEEQKTDHERWREKSNSVFHSFSMDPALRLCPFVRPRVHYARKTIPLFTGCQSLQCCSWNALVSALPNNTMNCLFFWSRHCPKKNVGHTSSSSPQLWRGQKQCCFGLVVMIIPFMSIVSE